MYFCSDWILTNMAIKPKWIITLFKMAKQTNKYG